MFKDSSGAALSNEQLAIVLMQYMNQLNITKKVPLF